MTSEPIKVETFSQIMKERMEGNDFNELGGVAGIMEKLFTSTNGIRVESIPVRKELYILLFFNKFYEGMEKINFLSQTLRIFLLCLLRLDDFL
jgi:hypothetical protein